MRRRIAISAGAMAAAILTQSFVYAASNLDSLQSGTFIGFFQQVTLLLERLWSMGHGWAPLSHVDTFGHWFADAVRFGCPAVGYLLFWLVSGQRLGRNGKPWAILAVGTVSLTWVLSNGGGSSFWVAAVETARTLLMLALMLWSSGALRGLTWRKTPGMAPAEAQ